MKAKTKIWSQICLAIIFALALHPGWFAPGATGGFSSGTVFAAASRNVGGGLSVNAGTNPRGQTQLNFSIGNFSAAFNISGQGSNCSGLDAVASAVENDLQPAANLADPQQHNAGSNLTQNTFALDPNFESSCATIAFDRITVQNQLAVVNPHQTQNIFVVVPNSSSFSALQLSTAPTQSHPAAIPDSASVLAAAVSRLRAAVKNFDPLAKPVETDKAINLAELSVWRC